jgi:thiaminase
MVAFTDRLVEANRAVWAAMAGHPFVLGLAHGTLPAVALQAWVQQDRVFVVEERRVVAALRAHGLPSRLDGLLADLDRSLVLEADAFTQTATDQGFAPDAEPWPVCLGYTSYLLCAAYDGTLEGLAALYAAERAYLDTWDRRRQAQPGRLPLPRLDPELEREAFRAFVTALGRDLDELAGAPSPTLAQRLGVVFTGAARFELAFWEMCWSGQAWPG